MAAGSVWISGTVVPLFHRLEEKLDGFSPILNVVGDGEPSPGPAALHRPTLYPELNVPASADREWGELARGIAHLLSSLDGVPELLVAGTERDAEITADLNSELQILAAVKEQLEPKPRSPPGVPAKLLDMILNPAQGTLDAARHFHLVRLHRFVLDGHPEAQAALDEARQKLPNDTIAAEATLNAILSEDLRSPAGKAAAASKFLKYLGFDSDLYYLRRSQHLPSFSDELVRMSTGAPTLKDELQLDTYAIERVIFARTENRKRQAEHAGPILKAIRRAAVG